MNQEFKEISNTIKSIDSILVELKNTNLTEEIQLSITRLNQGFNEYKIFF